MKKSIPLFVCYKLKEHPTDTTWIWIDSKIDCNSAASFMSYTIMGSRNILVASYNSWITVCTFVHKYLVYRYGYSGGHGIIINWESWTF